MTYTLSNLTYELALELGIVTEGLASGGTTAAILDTKRTEIEHYWKDGTAWIVESTDNLAPEGEYGVIKSYDESTHTVTIWTTFTAAVAANDKYALAHDQFPQYTLVQCVNRAIRDLGPIPITDTTTITTAANKTEYTLPGAASLDLREVWRQSITTDANDNRWALMPRGLWYVQRTATGTADELIFKEQISYPYALKLVYMDYHPKLKDYNDKLSETVNWERIIFRAALHAWSWYRNRTHSNDSYIADNIEYYQALAERADQRYPIIKPTKKAKILYISGAGDLDVPIGTVRAS